MDKEGESGLESGVFRRQGIGLAADSSPHFRWVVETEGPLPSIPTSPSLPSGVAGGLGSMSVYHSYI